MKINLLMLFLTPVIFAFSLNAHSGSYSPECSDQSSTKTQKVIANKNASKDLCVTSSAYSNCTQNPKEFCWAGQQPNSDFEYIKCTRAATDTLEQDSNNTHRCRSGNAHLIDCCVQAEAEPEPEPEPEQEQEQEEKQASESTCPLNITFKRYGLSDEKIQFDMKGCDKVAANSKDILSLLNDEVHPSKMYANYARGNVSFCGPCPKGKRKKTKYVNVHTTDGKSTHKYKVGLGACVCKKDGSKIFYPYRRKPLWKPIHKK